MKLTIGNYRANIRSEDLGSMGEHFAIENIDSIDDRDAFHCEILIWNNNYCFRNGYFDVFPSLKFFLNWGTGIRNIPKPEEFEKRGIVVKYFGNYATESVAEFAVGQLTTAARHTGHDCDAGTELYGKKIGIIGLGKIGFRVAQILRSAFKCGISYNSRRNKNIPGFTFCSVEDLLHDCDYVIITVKSKDFSLSAQQLEHGHPQLVIINLAEDEAAPINEVSKMLTTKKAHSVITDAFFDIDRVNTDSMRSTGHVAYKTEEARTTKMSLMRLILKKLYCSIRRKPLSIFFVRHGETAWNAKGIYQGTLNSPLSDKGKEQASCAAGFLREKNISKIISSPLERALETANSIANPLQCAVEVIPEFREMDFGMFQGKSKEKVQELHADFFEGRKNCKLYLLKNTQFSHLPPREQAELW
ncbi:MAG: histidine phosphatase family protein [Candidatus Peregrinibacteria bacterium]